MFLVDALLRPMSHLFCRIKDLRKMYNRCMFHQYRICDCQAKNFQITAYCLNIHGIILVVLLLQECPGFTDNFTRDSILEAKNTD